MTKPPIVAEADFVEALAQRYHRLPSEVAESDVYNYRHAIVLALAYPAPEPEPE